MKILGAYSFAKGREFVDKKYPQLLTEVKEVIKKVNAKKCLTKKSKEKTMKGKLLYSPVALNKEFKKYFNKKKWDADIREKCDYPTEFYLKGYSPKDVSRNAYRSMDFKKEKLGVEVQFGKYAFMVYNVCAKMTIFKRFGHIDCGIEIVPVKELAKQMSTGVSYFEQFVWDLEKRGHANIDVPVLILGIGV